MPPKHRTAAGAVLLLLLALVAVFLVSDSETVDAMCYLGAPVGAGVVALTGALRVPAGLRLVPALIAVGVSLSALGDVLWSVLDLMGTETDVSIADPPWFASYVFLCLALWLVLRRVPRGVRGPDLNPILDIVTVVAVSVLVFWSFSVETIVADDTVTPFVRAVWASYPVADAVLLALVARVLMSPSARSDVGLSFAIGAGLWLAADVGYLRSADGSDSAVVLDVLWMVAPVFLALAAWRPIDLHSLPSAHLTRGGWTGQLLIAVAPLFVPAALAVVADLRGHEDGPAQLFVGTVVLIALAFVRTGRLLRSEERAVRELESARDMAVVASRAKTLFVANMSHELRTPLTTVLASGELLEDTSLDDFQRNLLTKINRSGERLRSLVEGILDFSRIEAGQLKLAATRFDLHAVVADLADIYRSRTLPTGIRFECDIEQGVPETVIGDGARLFQILNNLLDNALKFTHDGEIRLAVRRAASRDARGVADIEFVVSDTGIGLRREDQDKIFGSFYQVDGSTTRRYGGNGLGLAICKELVDLMGGHIRLESRLRAGSTFLVRLPLTPVSSQRPPTTVETPFGAAT